MRVIACIFISLLYSCSTQVQPELRLAVDETVGMTGGRNIADRYFDFDTDYNFKDREVLVYGSTAGEMRASFEQFWESETTAEVGHLRDVAPLIVKGEVASLSGFEAATRLKMVLQDIDDVRLMHALFVDTAYHSRCDPILL